MHHKKGTTTPVLPEAAQGIQHCTGDHCTADQEIMIRFYRAIIESILTFSIVVWFGRTGQEEKQQPEASVEGASRFIWSELSSIESIYHARCAHKSRSIARDTTHPANHLFELLSSGKRRLPRAITLSSASSVLMFPCRHAHFTHLTTCMYFNDLLFLNVQTVAMVHS